MCDENGRTWRYTFDATNRVTGYTSPTGETSIRYDPRGIATQSAKTTFIFTHTTTDMLDSLCVSKLGNTIRARCP